MECPNCGNLTAWHVKTGFRAGVRSDQCNKCGLEGGGDVVADVFWPGNPHTNDQLVDNAGKPILLTSRAHKARVLREKGLIEAGDRVKGAPAGAGRGHWKET